MPSIRPISCNSVQLRATPCKTIFLQFFTIFSVNCSIILQIFFEFTTIQQQMHSFLCFFVCSMFSHCQILTIPDSFASNAAKPVNKPKNHRFAQFEAKRERLSSPKLQAERCTLCNYKSRSDTAAHNPMNPS